MSDRDLNRHQRAELVELARTIIARFEDDDVRLAAIVHAARPDSFPRGNDNTGRSSDVANPTLAAVLELERDELRVAEGRGPHANLAFDQLGLAVDLLISADRHRALSLNPVDPEPVAEMFCTNCRKVGNSQLRDTSRRFAQPCPWCTFCAGWRREHGWLPPEKILLKRAQGGRITTADEQEAVLEHVARRRARRRRR